VTPCSLRLPAHVHRCQSLGWHGGIVAGDTAAGMSIPASSPTPLSAVATLVTACKGMVAAGRRRTNPVFSKVAEVYLGFSSSVPVERMFKTAGHGVYKFRNFQPISGYMRETIQDRPQLLWNGNRKSYELYRTVIFQKTLSDV